MSAPSRTRWADWYREYWEVRPREAYAVASGLVARLEAILRVWPEQAASALDVGCGRGEVLGALRARGVRIFGCDLSGAAADVRADAAAVPFRDQSVDLVLASEVLEHLPEADLRASLAEAKRVARRWILVTVPLEEQLEFEQVTCGGCYGRFNSSGHLRSVSRDDIIGWFSGWRVVREMAVGERRWLWPTGMRLLWTLQGSASTSWTEAFVRCPMCGVDTRLKTPRDGVRWHLALRLRALFWHLGRRRPGVGVYLLER